MFQRLQHEMIEEDVEVMWRVVRAAVTAGRLPSAALHAVDIQGTAPTLAVRDRLREAQADQILVRSGAMSVATMAQRHGLDPDREQELMGHAVAATREQVGPRGGLADTDLNRKSRRQPRKI
jgi:hypothetical protein